MSRLTETRAIDLGLNSVKVNDELGVFRSIDFLTELGTEYINKKLEPDAKRTITLIKDIGKAAARQRMEVGAFLALRSLERMAKVASGKNLEDAGISIMYSLYSIGRTAAEEDMEIMVRIAASYLGAIGNAAALQKLRRESLVAPLSLGTIGTSVPRQSQSYEIENAGRLPGLFGPLVRGEMPSASRKINVSSSDLAGLAGILFAKERRKGFPEDAIFESENNYENPDLLKFEDAIIQAAHSLDTFIIEADARYLMTYVIMGKLGLDFSGETETANEAEKLDGIRANLEDN